jgi:hypothetical protein
MSLYHVVGSRLVGEEEARSRAKDHQKAGGEKEMSARAGPESVSIPVPGAEQIGTGKPLSIILRHVYTGRFPKGSGFGGSRKDFLLTSAVKDVFTTFNAAPRAVNMVRRRVTPGTGIAGLDATENGTPLVYYSPAVTTVSTTATVEMAFDDYPDELVSRIGNAISTAGGIPLFGPYGPVMIGVGLAIKLVSTVVNVLSDVKAEFSVSERLEFELPGGDPLDPGYRVLCEPSFDPMHLSLQFKLNVGLIDQQGRPYDGPEPYVVMLLDGKKQDAFKDFTPTAATAALLERFLQQKDGSDVVISTIVDAVKLYNDVRFRREADRLKEQLGGVNANSPEGQALKKKMDAMLANVGEQLLKPAP